VIVEAIKTAKFALNETSFISEYFTSESIIAAAAKGFKIVISEIVSNKISCIFFLILNL
jgi:hypothetical protein